MKKTILLFDDNDIDEMEWLTAASTNPVFNFLSEIEEDIYSLEDGKPFRFQSIDEIENAKKADS
jgi:hypothetical protein